MIKSKPKLPTLYLGGDILTLVVTFLVTLYFFKDFKYQEIESVLFVGIILLWFVSGYMSKSRDLKIYNHSRFYLLDYVKAYIVLLGLIYLFYAIYPFPLPNRNVVIAIVLGFPVLHIPMNFLIANLISNIKNSGDRTKYTLVAGVGNLANHVEKNMYAHYKKDYQVKGFLKCQEEECQVKQDKIVGDLSHLHEYLRDNPVDEIVIALPVKPSKKVRNIISAADYYGVRVKYIPDYQGLFGDNYRMTKFGQIDAVNIRQLPLDNTYAFLIKNCFDKIFAVAALTFLSPVLFLIALMIKFDSPGPVFYCPYRIGKGGRPFKVFKFRSMRTNDAVSGGALSTQRDDPRVTRLGRILRKYSLDELPQFVNVLLGDMSVVGPRPHRSYLNQQFQESVDKYMIRHYYKPGITGWAQVNGWRGPTESIEQKCQRTNHDLWYMENWTLWLDIRIIYKTIFSAKAHKSAF